MDVATLVGFVVGVVVVLALAALVVWAVKRRGAHRREERVGEAEHLRGEAASHNADIQAAEARARRADAAAEKARAEAEAAERVAADAHRDLAVEQAQQEDVVRQADALDPRVDTRGDGYSPVTGPAIKAPPAEQP